jgi:hypothetical protein
MPPVAVEQFLEGDFSIVRDLRALPAPVLRGLTGKDGSSLAMTNPWGIILESDLVAPGIPGARLIFAGTSREKGFVHFEAGGMWRWYPLILFTINSGGAKTVWLGVCNDRAMNLRDLRTLVLNGACKHFFPPAIVQPPIKAEGTSVFSARTTIPVTFSWINSDEPGCNLPPATIEIDRAAALKFPPKNYVLTPVDKSVYSLQTDKFTIDPNTCQYTYNLAAYRLGIGRYELNLIVNEDGIGHATFELR